MGNNNVVIFIGLVMISISIGHIFQPVFGWLVLGSGLIILAILDRI